MKMSQLRQAVVLLALLPLAAPAAPPAATAPTWLDLEAARRAFDDYAATCRRDGERLWGVTLCGPLMVVEPDSGLLVANTRPEPGDGGVSAVPGLFVSSLPSAQTSANTSGRWAGLLWAQVLWPLPDDADERRALLLHESFHRVQEALAWPAQGVGDGSNKHLDTLEGRYGLQLEWRALARALRSRGPERRRAVEDALLFRRARRSHFEAAAAAAENAMELHEGLAQYTGAKLANADPGRQRALALVYLERGPKADTFIRSFAYASGPAYGLLLDEAGVRWRSRATAATELDLGETLAAGLGLPSAPTPPTSAELTERAKAYDGGALRAAEEARAQMKARKLAELETRLVSGPVLTIARSKDTHVQFDPRTLVSLGAHGTVYPGARFSGEWGELSTTSGALIDDRWTTITVPAPTEGHQRAWRGDGWILELAPGWTLGPGHRPGDRRVVAEPTAPRPSQ